MATITCTDTRLVDAPVPKAETAFLDLWGAVSETPSARYWANPTFTRAASGSFHQLTGLRPFGEMETWVTMRAVGDKTEVTYKRQLRTGPLRPPIPGAVYERGWRSLFAMWHTSIERQLSSQQRGGLD